MNFAFMERGIFLYLPTIFTFLLFSLLTTWALYGLKRKNSKDRKKELAILGIILIFALLIRIKVPHMPGSGGEEYRYVMVGKNVARSGRFIAPRDVILDKQPVLYLKPYLTYPGLIAVPSLFLKTTRSLGININILMGSLTIFGVYFLVREFSSEKVPALLAAILTAFLPLSIYLSNTSESHIVSVFFFTFFLGSFIKYLEDGEFYWGLGSTLLFVAVIFSRAANWIFLPVTLLIVTIYRKDKVFQRKNIIFALIFISLSIVPFLMNLRFGTHAEMAFSGKYFAENITAFIKYIFQERLYYGLLFVLAPIGFVSSIKRGEGKRSLALALPFFIYLPFILFYRWGITSFSRYYFLPFLYFSVFSSIAIYHIYKELGSKLSFLSEHFSEIFLILVVVLMGSWCTFSTLNFQAGIEYPSAEEMVGKAKEMYPKCTVLPAEDARPVQLAGYSVINPWYHEEEELANESWYRKNLNSTCLLYYKAGLKYGDRKNATPP